MVILKNLWKSVGGKTLDCQGRRRQDLEVGHGEGKQFFANPPKQNDQGSSPKGSPGRDEEFLWVKPEKDERAGRNPASEVVFLLVVNDRFAHLEEKELRKPVFVGDSELMFAES